MTAPSFAPSLHISSLQVDCHQKPAKRQREDSSIASRISSSLKRKVPFLQHSVELLQESFEKIAQSPLAQRVSLLDSASDDTKTAHRGLDEEQDISSSSSSKRVRSVENFQNFFGNVAQGLKGIKKELVDTAERKNAKEFITRYKKCKKELEASINFQLSATFFNTSASCSAPSPSSSSSVSSASYSSSVFNSLKTNPCSSAYPIILKSEIILINQWNNREAPTCILIVEDNITNIKVLKAFFIKKGYFEWDQQSERDEKSFICATTVAEAQSIIDKYIEKEQVIDFACLDIRLDQGMRITGEHLAKKIREIEKTKYQKSIQEGMPLIVISSDNLMHQSEVNILIKKPFKFNQLESCINGQCPLEEL